jgi:hypothetical protein
VPNLKQNPVAKRCRVFVFIYISERKTFLIAIPLDIIDIHLNDVTNYENKYFIMTMYIAKFSS